MTAIEEKLDQIIQDLEQIKSHLKIVPDKDSEIIDTKSSISEYEKFAKEDLKLNEKNNNKSIIYYCSIFVSLKRYNQQRYSQRLS